jgi:hypothetical protein
MGIPRLFRGRKGRWRIEVQVGKSRDQEEGEGLVGLKRTLKNKFA